MKTIFKISIFLFGVIILLSTCTACTKSVEYTEIFRGFIATENMKIDFPCDEPLIFNTSKEWDEFTQRYFSRLSWILGKNDINIDFSSQTLMCEIGMPMHDVYNHSWSNHIKKITLNGYTMNIYESGDENYVYITSDSIDDGIIYPFIVLTTIEGKIGRVDNFNYHYK